MEVIIITPAAYKETLDALAVAQFAATVQNLFSYELFDSPVVEEQTTPTHYYTIQTMPESTFTRLAPLKLAFPGVVIEAYDDGENPGFPLQLFAALGLSGRTPVM